MVPAWQSDDEVLKHMLKCSLHSKKTVFTVWWTVWHTLLLLEETIMAASTVKKPMLRTRRILLNNRAYSAEKDRWIPLHNNANPHISRTV